MRCLVLLLVIVLWQIEMAVHSGIAASRRPARPAVVDVTPTPTPSRQTPVDCKGPSCPQPSPPQPTSRIVK